MPATSINTGLKHILKYWLAVLLWMGIIFYFSSLPGKDIPSLFPFQDVLFHFIIYAGLAYLFKRALKNTCHKLTPARLISLALIFCFIYGLSDEFHQSFVAGRDASSLDLFIDTLGSFTGSFF